MDENLIPKGIYCYEYFKDGSMKTCPYWKKLKDRPEQEDGWCDYLGEGDIEINEREEWILTKTGERKTAKDLGLPLSLLWDMCKMCQINEEEE